MEKEIATHSSVLAWRIPWAEELGGPQSMGSKKSDRTERLTLTNSHLKDSRLIPVRKGKKEHIGSNSLGKGSLY